MKVVIGLGNHGDKFDNTYHNMGFWTVDMLAKKAGIKFKDIRCKAIVAEGFLSGEKYVLAKPLTFMNLSGEAVRELLGYYHAALSDIAVAYDDIDLSVGDLRIRKSGSSGTHNGMRNILSILKDENFLRFRLGIGRPPEHILLADFVTSRIAKPDYDPLLCAVDKASDALLSWLNGTPADGIMNKFN